MDVPYHLNKTFIMQRLIKDNVQAYTTGILVHVLIHLELSRLWAHFLER